MRNVLKQVGTGLALAVAGVGSALAVDPTYSTFDTSGANTAILAMVAGLILIGGAVFALTLGIKSTKWARKAL